MIRLPPTSISLSESDTQLHLREINIYQSLLEQGFTREAIQRYYASMRVSEPEGHSNSQSPPLQRTHRASSDEEGSITHGDHPTSSRNPYQHEIRPVSPITESNEARKATAEADHIRKWRASQASPQPAELVEQDSRRKGVGNSKQPACHENGREQGCTDAGIVERYGSRDICPFAPSSVELRARSRLPSGCFPLLSRDPSDDHGELSSKASEGYARLQEQGNKDDDASDLHSPPLASNLNLPIRHHPRQSSMLHITRNAASPSSSGHSDDSFKSTVTEMPRADTPEFETSPRTRTKTYRPRSQTYSWVQSEADDPKDTLQPVSPGEGSSFFHPPQRAFRATPTEVRQTSVNKADSPPTELRPISVTRIESSPAETTIVKSHCQISSSTPLRAEAEDFVPLKLPPPFSATRRVSSGQHSLSSSIRNTSTSILRHEIHSPSSPNLAVSTPPRSSSIGSIKRHLGSCFTSSPERDFASSPPIPRGPDRSPELSPIRRVPTTPGHRGRKTFRETQFRALPKTPRTQASIQQTNGPGIVYDDRVPANLQPRTPADLTRVIQVTDREAAYTVPPGRTARTPATISQALLSPIRPFEPGEESPSRRARTIRDRRARELRRSAIMEGAMWERFRETGADAVDGMMHWDGSGPGLMNGWRDDFDADRIGEENFGEEGFMRTPSLGPRVPGSVRATRRRGP